LTLLYRVSWVDDDWESLDSAAPFHPLYVPIDRQGQGRFDNPHLYAALYIATTPQGAIGETFGNLSRWPSAEIERTKDGRPRCLVQYDLPDDAIVRDLDDPKVLSELGIRPSDVVRRNRDHTQEVANSVWQTHAATGVSGFSWWSYWRPEWTMVVLWSDGLGHPYFPTVDVTQVEPLGLGHPAVRVAADVLPRELGP
jgi:RES domain